MIESVPYMTDLLLQAVFVIISSLSISAIATDRYVAICRSAQVIPSYFQWKLVMFVSWRQVNNNHDDQDYPASVHVLAAL